MEEITHNQARQYLLADADGLLDNAQRAALHSHLRSCEKCRAESDHLAELHHGLRSAFHERWDTIPLPDSLLVTEFPQAEPIWPRLGRMIVNLSLVALWVWLYRAVFGYFRIIFSIEEFRTNQIVLAIVLVLLFVQSRRERWHLRLDNLPQIFWPGLSLAFTGSVLYLLVERFLDINTLSASLFGQPTSR